MVIHLQYSHYTFRNHFNDIACEPDNLSGNIKKCQGQYANRIITYRKQHRFNRSQCK